MNHQLPESAPTATAGSPALATPAMTQYFAAKRAHPDCLLFYRMGDFYELFFDDALKAAPILDIAFDLKGAEVTLEGVPAYFLRGKPRLVDVMQAELPARHFRLSMGIQTFDETRLKQMGRAAFGNAATFREVVETAHAAGFSVSADFLFNLPGQTLDEMKDDVRRAVDLGLDHLGLYHLVMFAGLICFLYNLWMTARGEESPAAASSTSPAPVSA